MIKKKIMKGFASVLVLMNVLVMAGCGNSQKNNGGLDADDIVPSKQSLVDALTKEGYVISELDISVVVSEDADRVYAEKGDSFIDIVYGLKKEETHKVLNEYTTLYQNYYILAINGTYVYCIGDKAAFTSAGFTSTANVGVQYISE